jgi:hypothetical protein
MICLIISMFYSESHNCLALCFLLGIVPRDMPAPNGVFLISLLMNGEWCLMVVFSRSTAASS